jgi:stage II sporulation protein GA (sporulation sigma-E factor processing peptidase)
MRTVYIETFLADNFLMDYLILYLTSKIVCAPSHWGRLMAASAAGSAYALAVFVLSAYFLNSLAFKIAVSALICAVAFGFGSVRSFLSRFFGMIVTTLFLAGGAFFTVYLFGGEIGQAGGVWIDSAEFRYILLGTLVASLLIVRIRDMLRRINVKESLIQKIRIVSGGRAVDLDAFLDTGNDLKGLLGEPVIMAEKKRVEGLINGQKEKNMIRIPYKTAAGCCEAEAFLADEVVFLSGEKRRVSGVLIALYGGKLCPDGRFCALIGPQILF